MAKKGRPPKEIDVKKVKLLAKMGCTYEEIATVMECSTKTLQRHFVHTIKEGQRSLKVSLRRKQYEVAMNGSTGMLIWMGKQHLGQSDKQDLKGTMSFKYLSHIPRKHG